MSQLLMLPTVTIVPGAAAMSFIVITKYIVTLKQ